MLRKNTFLSILCNICPFLGKVDDNSGKYPFRPHFRTAIGCLISHLGEGGADQIISFKNWDEDEIALAYSIMLS